MSVQRRRGIPVTVYRMERTTDRRGNSLAVKTVQLPHQVKAAIIPQRSAKAEVPGQQQINVVRLIVDPNMEGVGLWSMVEFNGTKWDVVTPPAYHHGSRRTRHWSIDVRQRPA